jgi:hypothetical protein
MKSVTGMMKKETLERIRKLTELKYSFKGDGKHTLELPQSSR